MNKLTAKMPVAVRIAKTAQKEMLAAAGVKAVKIALKAIVYPTIARPPIHSANRPPGNDVTRYPQKYEPNKRLCSEAVQLYLGPY